MLSKKIFGIPSWVWLIIIILIIYNCYKTTEKFNEMNKNENNKDKDNKNENNKDKDNKNEDNKDERNKELKIKILNFSVDWCGYSRRFKPEWDKFVENLQMKNVETNYIDGDKNTELLNEYKIEGYPTVLFIIDGNPEIYKGERTKEGLESVLNKLN